MSERNPYAPPAADVDRAAAMGSPARTPFFAVSVFKLALLSFFTFGMYDIYWFYRNWQIIKMGEGIDISPFWRTFFAFFFCHQCFSRVRDYEHPTLSRGTLPAGLLAAGWIIVNLLWLLPDPSWLLTNLSFLFILPVQHRANQINSAVEPLHDPNARLTGLNWTGVIVGGVFWVLVIIGTVFNSIAMEMATGRV